MTNVQQLVAGIIPKLVTSLGPPWQHPPCPLTQFLEELLVLAEGTHGGRHMSCTMAMLEKCSIPVWLRIT